MFSITVCFTITSLTCKGGTQLLSKIKPYWEYLLPDMDKKLKKAILKASHVDKYLEAVGIALMSKTYYKNSFEKSVYREFVLLCSIST